MLKWVFDLQGKPVDYIVLDVNPAYEKQSGLCAKKVIGKRVAELVDSVEPVWLERFGKVVSSGESKNFEVYTAYLDRWFSVNAFPLPVKNQFGMIFSDITIRRQAEELLKKNNEALAKNLEMKDEFLSLISHELRTPLTVIISAIQMLKTFAWDELSDKAKGYYNTIRQNSNRQLKLVNNILDITKVNAGCFEVRRTNSDIVQLTKLILESIGPYADRKKIRISFSCFLTEMIIGVDEEKYERILLNLLSNAIKYTPKGESVTVNLSPKIVDNHAMACIQVCDYGIGVPADKQEHIFERFGQVESVLSRRSEGTGIGLHLTRMFVEMMGGEIQLDSNLGNGSTFTVLLPDIKIQSEAPGKAASETTDNRIIQATEIEFSDVYLK